MTNEQERALPGVNPTASAIPAWTPVLTPALRVAARAAAADIARAVPAHIPRNSDGTINPSFGGGTAGVAVFLHYAGTALEDESLDAACVEHLGQALEGMQALPGAGLFAGFTGVAWAVSHLQQRGVDALDDVDLNEIDSLLEAVLRRVPWTDDYDLISGLVGIGVYGLERMHQGCGERVVAAVVARLSEQVERMGPWLSAWFHPPWQVPASARPDFPEGWYNLGMAHGTPGVLAFLARAVRNDVRRTTAAKLLASGSGWVCTQLRGNAPQNVRIGYQIDPRAPHAESPASRDAWCYGAPGVAVALLAAGTVLNEEPLQTAGLALARTAAPNGPDAAGVHDASFCHGSSGLAHLYARLYQVTGDPAFADAARRWTDHTLAFRRPGDGVGGFLHLRWPNDHPTWVAESGFLEGAAGIGLVLLSMSSPETPAWDRFVLADPSVSPPATVG